MTQNIKIGKGKCFKRLRVKWEGQDILLGPASDSALLRMTIKELSSFIDGHDFTISDNTPNFTLYQIAKELSILIVKEQYNASH